MAVLYIFWISFAVIFYTYVGYALALVILTSLRKSSAPYQSINDSELPPVTLVVAAYNEAEFIAKKVENCLQLDYPVEKIFFYFVTDGSTDSTPEILRGFKEVKLFHEPVRKGKIHAVNRIMDRVTTPVTVFCDANSFLNRDAIRMLVRHYQDPSVGGVAGEKKIFQQTAESASGAGEGLYWKYESFLKQKDAQLYSVVGAAGELFSIRTSLYEKPGADVIIEDFFLSMRVTARGHRFAYEPKAYASESASTTVSEEWKRKVRICAGSFQAMSRLSYLLNPFRYGWLWFQYVSHRVLRWTLAPLSLCLMLFSNSMLAARGLPFYQGTLLLQVAFYGLAVLGHILRDRPLSIKGLFVPYYFTVMNLAVYAGFWRFLRGSQSVTWERAKRAKSGEIGL
jgi:poly-beta-1,6-N-acetyl-D-glucosamine synthase